MTPFDPTKVSLSHEERVTLCDDISRFSLLLGREAQNADSATIGADSAISQAESSPLERLRLLANLWPRLEAALRAIAACPDSALVSESRSLPIQAARGSSATLARLARHAADQRAWAQTARRSESETPAHIREPGPVRTVQTAANRIAVGFLEVLAQETRALHRLALFCEETTSAAAAEQLNRDIRRWLRESPFCECVKPPQGGQAAETLLRCSPAYRSLYEEIDRLRSCLQIDWSESAVLRFPVLEDWHLYEIWCFLRVGMAVREIGWKTGETDCLPIVPTGMRLRLAHGKASRIRFHATGGRESPSDPNAGLELIYQPLFSSANQGTMLPQTGYRSLSHVMQPDIALVRHGRLLLLDPKYRSYGTDGDEQEDVDKMHAYRDAIVRTDPITGRPVPAVDAAWCLFPGLPPSASSRPEHLRAYPASTPEQPFGTAGVGAVQVRPGADNVELTALLRCWLEAV